MENEKKGKKGLSQILFGIPRKEVVNGYKFLSQDMRSRYGDRPRWSLGVPLTYDGKIRPCSSGFHASLDLYSAYRNSPIGDRLFEVEARGVVEGEDGLFAAREMMLVREIDSESLSIDYAINCAKHVLRHYEEIYPGDDRPRKAIEAAENYLNSPSEKNRSAARSADWSAESAAESAARSADWSDWSAWSVAKSAAKSAAESAGWFNNGFSEEEKWQKKLLEELVKKY